MPRNYNKKVKASGEVDLLRDAFLKEENERKRNFLITKLINVWLPYLNKKISDFNKEEQDEIRQIYNVRVLDCIYSFKGKNGASFKSYLFWAAKGALDKYLGFNRKVRLEHNYEDIDDQTPMMMSSIINSYVHNDSEYNCSMNYDNTSNEYYSEEYYEDQIINGAIEL